MKIIKALLFTILISLPNSALAGLVTVQFNNGDSLSSWSADRRAPAGFQIVNNELQMSINGADKNTALDFVNTQGMQMDIGHSTYLSIDMYIDSTWPNSLRNAGLWAIGFTNFLDLSVAPGGKTFPILEYKNTGPGTFGVSPFVSTYGWFDPFAAAANLDAWNTLKFIIGPAGSAYPGVQYYVNDNFFFWDNVTGTEYFTGVILNAKNEGNSYNVRYDNLTYGNVPEPAPLALLGLGLLGLGIARKRRG